MRLPHLCRLDRWDESARRQPNPFEPSPFKAELLRPTLQRSANRRLNLELLVMPCSPPCPHLLKGAKVIARLRRYSLAQLKLTPRNRPSDTINTDFSSPRPTTGCGTAAIGLAIPRGFAFTKWAGR